MNSAPKIIDFVTYKNNRNRTPVDTSNEYSMFGKGLTDETMSYLTRKFSNPVSERDYRNLAIFLILSQTALRAKEAVNLKFSDLLKAPTNETLAKYVKKGGRIAYSVISESCLKAVQEYHSKFDLKSDYFFLSLPLRNQNWRSNLSTRGLQLIVNSWNVSTCSGKRVHPHSFRHTAGNKLFNDSGSIAVQKVLAHSSVETSARYYLKPFYDGSKHLTWE
ncbi:site-specific integrase [Leptospira weilii]|uniref:Site-specific recombinase, phage integrase family n=1 Tax=Leptospira weilii str. 2006001855 TaxID=996804 RepID=M6FIN2_9LEPT|nr:tyrosine-type recombinase/integrase [Leptospira weilii]EMM72638.1 site-specific recombinase, phage integrase family [Leptospira weilii str. 2006001855]MCL8268314.1 site-specific integrase [Leptospira weilii]